MKERVKGFFEVLATVTPSGINDMGLIICEDEDRGKINDLFSKKITQVDYTNDSSDSELLEAMIKSMENESWLVINYAGKPISSQVYSALRRLSTSNLLQLLNFDGKDEVNIKQPDEMRVIFLTTWEDIRNSNIPDFTHLFGPVLDLSREGDIS